MNDGLKDKLINTARAKGICAEGYKQMLGSTDAEAMVDYYVENPDWCLERNFPTLAMLREHFAECGDKGVFVDRTFHGEVLNERQTYIFHNCKGTIKVGLNVDKAIIPMLYLANGCRLRIVGSFSGEGGAEMVASEEEGVLRPYKGAKVRVRVPVYVFGENDYSARDNKYVEFNVFRHDLI